MADRRVNLLHVEDDELQQRLVAGILGMLEGLRFNVIHATTEDEAADAFTRVRFDLVVVDYQLEKGNGLQCLRRIRRRDSIVPIIAVSGTATTAIAKELLRLGADDFLQKADLTSEVLGQSVRAALARSDRWRRHLPHEAEDKPNQIEEKLRAVCDRYVKGLGEDWLPAIEELEALIREANISTSALETMFELTTSDVNLSGPAAGKATRYLRPLWLELLIRLK